MPLGLGLLTCFLTSEEDQLLAEQSSFIEIDNVEFMLMVDFKNILEFLYFKINNIEFMSI